MRTLTSGHWGGGITILAIGALLVPIGWAMGGMSGIDQATIWVVFGLFAISVDLLWGYCGMLSFGQAVFFGLGAFQYTWLTTDTVGLNLGAAGTLIGLIAGLIAPALFAMLLGYFLFYGRVVGAFFTIVMLALSFLMQSLGQGWSQAFGGFTGIPGVPGIVGIEGVIPSYVFCLVVTAGVVVLLRWLTSTPFGLGVDGVRDNEERLAFLGQKTVETKLVVFTLSAAVAGLAGALYASQANYVASDLMGTLLSTEAVVWVAVGGRRTLIGAFIGALVVRGVGFWLSGIAIDWWLVILGFLFVIIVLAGSTGLAGLGRWLWERGARVAAGNR
jgi:branched-chain amino acid transport system permease protein